MLAPHTRTAQRIAAQARTSDHHSVTLGRGQACSGVDATVGREDSERAISRGSGAAARLPEEFREVLQDYFKAVEAMEGDGKR